MAALTPFYLTGNELKVTRTSSELGKANPYVFKFTLPSKLIYGSKMIFTIPKN